ncbi:unannotated protein [freshwater metagenome]|uniref:Unannotated protein n=1 Tax=freshwater metagenome TaxID=449393 RepID=A0A6J6MCG8_9ZZZZ|nr:hypothetical protein [Actinomycetota bacterium]
MKRLLVVAVVLLSACSSTTKSTPDNEKDTAVVAACAATIEKPTMGLSAITEKYRVRVWDDPSSNTPRELDQLGDDPFAQTTGNDLTVVESVAVSPKDCTVFVGACCEPVSGITFYEGKKKGEWLQLMGHLPAISPDGELLALVTYEELLISSVAAPEKPSTTIALPKANEATMYKSAWINGDQVAISGFTPKGAFVWIATVSEGTLRSGELITDTVNWESEDLWRVGLVGADENENLVTRRDGAEGKDILDFRYAEAFESHSTIEIPRGTASYVMNGQRSAMVTEKGVLSVWAGNGDPVQLGAGYVWAG